MDAFRLPKNADDEKKARQEAIESATVNAIESPLNIMRVSCEQFALMLAMVNEGNPNSVSDAGVGASCLLAAVEGGWMNVMINLPGLKNKDMALSFKKEADDWLEKARREKENIFGLVAEKIST